MAEPTFDAATEQIYHRLPEHFRQADSKFYYLKRYLSGVGMIQNRLDTIIERLRYLTPDEGGLPNDTSDLVDPVTADISWLPWLAQLLGVSLKGKVLDETTRNEIINASNGYLSGTDAAIVAAVQTELVGSKSVNLVRRNTSSGAGGVWDLLIQTLQSETLQNILPNSIIVPTSAQNYTINSVPGGHTERVSLYVHSDPLFYNGKALQFFAVPTDSGTGSESGDVPGFGLDNFGQEAFGSGNPTTIDIATEFYYYTPGYFELDASDPLTTMVDVAYVSGTNDHILVSAGIELFHYATGTYTTTGVIVGVTDQNLNRGTIGRFLGRSEGIGSTVTHGRWVVRFKNVGPNAVIDSGHFGARKENNTTWVPRSADPIAAVIDRGAKPAGVKLWHSDLVSSWDALENGGATTWADIEGSKWTDVEEFGS